MLRKVLLLLVIVLIGYTHLSFSQDTTKSVKAVRTTPPQIDGILNDSEWLHSTQLIPVWRNRHY